MKNALRQQMREKRKALSPTSYAEKSRLIRENLEKLPTYQAAARLLIYVSMNDEVDTHELIQNALAAKRAVYVPKLVDDRIVICPLNDWADLELGTFGILEPCIILQEIEPSDIDFIVVPGLAFDARGHRVGYGKGHYDRLLKSTKGYKVGLAFSEQIIDHVPEEEHDVPLDLIITDQSLLTPNS